MLEKIKEVFEWLWYFPYEEVVIKPNAEILFQKRVEDEKWTKYFINFFLYDNKIWIWNSILESDAQFKKDDDTTINVEIFSLAVSLEKLDKEKIIKNIKKYENEYEKIFKNMWYEYYEEIK